MKKMYKKNTFDFSSLLGGFLSGGFCPVPVQGIQFLCGMTKCLENDIAIAHQEPL
jgi:hypothetical protein